MKKKNSGVTLIELEAVIGIIAVLFLITAPFYRNFQTKLLLKSSSESISSYIKNAKSLAINYNRKFSIIIDPIQSKISTYDYIDTDPDNPFVSDTDAIARRDQEVAEAGDVKSDAIQNVSDYTLPGQLEITTSGAITQITVSSSGSMNGCSIWIKNKSGDSCYTVTTTTTGAIRIYDYEKPQN